MCGIVGVMGDFSDKKSVFNFLLQIDVVRGWDSTGMLSVNAKDMEVGWYKDTLLPQELISEPEYLELIGSRASMGKKLIDPLLLMGHNRAATKGTVIADNAHPFAQEHIFLTHNGTIHNLYPLQNQIEGRFDTDSETLTRVIAEKGVDKAWPAMTGAASIAYYDSSEETLNLISNGERPLFFAQGKDDKFMVYASELWMLHAAKQKFDLSIVKFFSLTDNTLHRFSNDTKNKIVTMTMKTLKKYELPDYRGTQGAKHSHWFDRKRRNSYVPQCDIGTGAAASHGANVLSIEKIGKRKRRRLERLCRSKVRKIVAKSSNYHIAINMSISHPYRGEPALNQMMQEALWEHFFEKKDENKDKQKHIDKVDEKFDMKDVLKTKGYGYAFDDMSEEEFAATYGKSYCLYCGDSLADEYDTAVILDVEHAICGKDAKTAAEENMSLAFVM
jgi:predicted glutamine amidotransferase